MISVNYTALYSDDYDDRLDDNNFLLRSRAWVVRKSILLP